MTIALIVIGVILFVVIELDDWISMWQGPRK